MKKKLTPTVMFLRPIFSFFLQKSFILKTFYREKRGSRDSLKSEKKA